MSRGDVGTVVPAYVGDGLQLRPLIVPPHVEAAFACVEAAILHSAGFAPPDLEESNRRSVEATRMLDQAASVKLPEVRKGRFDWAGDVPSPLDTTRASLDALSPVMERAAAAVEGRALPLGVSCPDCEGRPKPVSLIVPLIESSPELQLMAALDFVVADFERRARAGIAPLSEGSISRAVAWLAERNPRPPF